jgi:hypothetical protein
VQTILAVGGYVHGKGRLLAEHRRYVAREPVLIFYDQHSHVFSSPPGQGCRRNDTRSPALKSNPDRPAYRRLETTVRPIFLGFPRRRV